MTNLRFYKRLASRDQDAEDYYEYSYYSDEERPPAAAPTGATAQGKGKVQSV